MKLVAALLLAGSAVGCGTTVKIGEVTAARGDADDLVVRFTADRDVTHAAQWPGASLFVVSQADPETRASRGAQESGHIWVFLEERSKVEELPGPSGPCHVFRVQFPLRADGSNGTIPYDLTRPGVHDLEFWTCGGSCWFGPSYTSNRVRLTYTAP